MLLWFVGPSVAIAWSVFRSPALDHRVVAGAAVLPLAEVAVGGPKVLHTLAGAVAALVGVMVATRGRRLVRRRWLGLPIGLFLHLVLDATWARTELFWWPAFGAGFPAGALPELDRGLAPVLFLEALGAAACWWCWRTFGLADPARRSRMARTGRVDRSLLPPG